MPVKILFYPTLDHAKGLPTDGGRAWVYLGGNVTNIRRCSGLLGPAWRVPIGLSLEKVALRIRQPFVDWIGEIASEQQDLDKFWAITFTARSPETSDLFELICLSILLEDLKSEKPDLLAVIEDPWLFALLAERCESEGSYQASLSRKKQMSHGWCRVLPGRVAFLARGVARVFLSRTLALRQEKGERRIRLIGYAFEQALSRSPYTDPFFGDLPTLLAKQKSEVNFLFPLHTPSKLFGRIAKIPKAEVLAAWAKLSDLLVAAFGWAKLEPNVPKFLGISLEWLLRRELLGENSSNRYALNLWQAKTWRQFAKRAQGAVVHTFENHPWEKSMHSALQDSGVKRIGYQHATIPELLLNYYPAQGEDCFQPQWIIANSPENQKILKERGWKAESVSMGGALRYSGSPRSFEAPARVAGAIPTLYVVLPGAPNLAQNFLAALAAARESLNPERPRIRMLLKFHPSLDYSEGDFSGIDGAERTVVPLDKIASSIDAVLFASSTLGLEALLLGLPVYRYVPEGQLSLDPIPRTYTDRVESCDQAGLKALLHSLSTRMTEIRSVAGADKVLFAPVESDVWLRAVEGKV